MRAFAKFGFIVASAAILLPCPRSNADLMLLTIRAPEQCPDGLTIKSNAGDGGMLEFEVLVDPEAIAHAGELYTGRVGAHANLNVATPEQQVALVTLQGATEGQRTRYHFRISPSAAKASDLQLGVTLLEKDGFATVGGGVSMQVHLSGFVPTGGQPKPR